jgi:hypothetical protein
VLQGIRAAAVFYGANLAILRVLYFKIAIISLTIFRINVNVFYDRAKADGLPDHRLVLVRQINRFGVAAAFNIEHRAFRPAVLVIANQISDLGQQTA